MNDAVADFKHLPAKLISLSGLYHTATRGPWRLFHQKIISFLLVSSPAGSLNAWHARKGKVHGMERGNGGDEREGRKELYGKNDGREKEKKGNDDGEE